MAVKMVTLAVRSSHGVVANACKIYVKQGLFESRGGVVALLITNQQSKAKNIAYTQLIPQLII